MLLPRDRVTDNVDGQDNMLCLWLPPCSALCLCLDSIVTVVCVEGDKSIKPQFRALGQTRRGKAIATKYAPERRSLFVGL